MSYASLCSVDIGNARGLEFWSRSMGFTLIDPVEFRDRQSIVQRFLSWFNGGTNGFHLVVPSVILKRSDVERLIEHAQLLKAVAQNEKSTRM